MTARARKPIPPFQQARVCVCGDHGFLGLPRSYVTLFSPRHMQAVSASRWTILKGDGRYYVRRSSGDRKLLHRVLAGAESGRLVDHRSGDAMDNQDGNIRVCSNTENSRNNGKVRGKSGFKGVHVGPNRIGWVVGIGIAGRTKYIGYFRDPIEAARAYDAAAIAHFGEFARTNADLGLLPLEAA